jgi:uroporphyrinogen III methyltransferase/synthase
MLRISGRASPGEWDCMAEGRIIVTGTHEDAAAFAMRLQAAGFDAYPLATIRITRKALSKASVAALRDIGSYDYLLFTSARAVEIFGDIVRDLSTKKPRGIKVVAVGPRTARACRAIGFNPHIVPKEFNAREMARAMTVTRGKRILFPSSAIASPETKKALEAAGAIVTPIPLYTTTSIAAPKKVFQNLAKDAGWIVFMSPSGVAGFVKNLTGTILKRQAASARVVCIGPTTAQAAIKAGFRHVTIARPSTADGIEKTLLFLYTRRPR